jgi:hypothetical protein
MVESPTPHPQEDASEATAAAVRVAPSRRPWRVPRDAEWLLIGGLLVASLGTWRAYFDHNSSPLVIAGTILSAFALISPRITRISLGFGDAKVGADLVPVLEQAERTNMRAAEAIDAVRDRVPEGVERDKLDEALGAVHQTTRELDRVRERLGGRPLRLARANHTRQLPDGTRTLYLRPYAEAADRRGDVRCTVRVSTGEGEQVNEPRSWYSRNVRLGDMPELSITFPTTFRIDQPAEGTRVLVVWELRDYLAPWERLATDEFVIEPGGAAPPE